MTEITDRANTYEWGRALPAKCKCDPRTWGPLIEDICASFDSNGGKGCRTCYHDKDCHGPACREGGTK